MGNTVKALAGPGHAKALAEALADPIVQDMATEVHGMGDAVRRQAQHWGADGAATGPTSEFIGAANDRYEQLGGEATWKLGTVATAVLTLAAELDERATTPPQN